MGALAAASVSNALGNNRHHPSVEYYADYYAVQDQRSMINYNDITHANAAATTATATTATPTDTAVNENDPSPKKYVCISACLHTSFITSIGRSFAAIDG